MEEGSGEADLFYNREVLLLSEYLSMTVERMWRSHFALKDYKIINNKL